MGDCIRIDFASQGDRRRYASAIIYASRVWCVRASKLERDGGEVLEGSQIVLRV